MDSMTNDDSVQSFYRLRPEVPGGFGEHSLLDTSTHPPIVHRLHLEFTGWDGDDLVESFPCFLVSDRLGAALLAARLTGFELADVEISLDEQFVALFPEAASALPPWRWLKLVGVPFASDFWVDKQANLHVSRASLNVLRRYSLSHCEILEV